MQRIYFNGDSKQFLRSGDINTLMYKVRLLEKERKQCLEKKNIQ